MPHYDDPDQLALFDDAALRPSDLHELGRLQRGWETADFDHGWTAAAIEARLEGRP